MPKLAFQPWFPVRFLRGNVKIRHNLSRSLEPYSVSLANSVQKKMMERWGEPGRGVNRPMSNVKGARSFSILFVVLATGRLLGSGAAPQHVIATVRRSRLTTR
jgi:hypothetical protein